MRSYSAVVVFSILSLSASAQQKKEPVDYVDPNIGGIGQLLTATSPTVHMPYSMMRIAPITTPGITDRYLADRIYGFPAGRLTMMPVTGRVETDPARNASRFDHDLETATPYYYAVTLEKDNTEVEYTVTERAAYYRIGFPEGAPAHVLFSVPQAGQIQVVGPTALSGGEAGGRSGYFYAEFSKPAASSQAWRGTQAPQDRRDGAGAATGIVADFAPAKGERIGIRIGMSYISTEQARKNLQRENPGWDFEQVKAQSRAAWNRALAKLAVKGGTEAQRTIFYTAMYRVMQRPVNVVEDGRYYSPGDKQVHPSDSHGFYPSGGGLWGSYRSLHPLQLILDPGRQLDYVRSFLALYAQTGRMVGTGLGGMIGHHVAALVLDTWAKGYRDFDIVKAFEGLKKNATEVTMLPWRDGPLTSLDRVYQEKGFFPALAKGESETVSQVHPLERRQAVAVTLEGAYDEWCTAQVAKLANRPEDYEFFMKRAHNYENVFDKRIGFMAPKSADGKWVEDFDPKWGGGWGGRDYFTENNGWTYLFQVQHDIEGLARLLGGRDALAAKLDQLFVEQWGPHKVLRWPGDQKNPPVWVEAKKYDFLVVWDNMTGLIGNYAQGNEPGFHIPYLYNYVNRPWETQRRVRQIMSVYYEATPLGICGDEDSGEMSSWYVLSAMGFFPVTPGLPVYEIGSPIFDETRIAMPGGKVFTITARNNSARNKYIQSAALNGKPLNKPWFEHADMANGGTLVLVMGPRPNTAWGSAPDAVPPSMTR